MPSRFVCDNGHHIIMNIFTAKISELDKNFLDYDTKYWDKKELISKNYQLDFENAIIIVIFSYSKNNSGEYLDKRMWTTIRRHTKDKFSWYKKQIGKEIEIVIEKKD
jgi:hypothetical protein